AGNQPVGFGNDLQRTGLALGPLDHGQVVSEVDRYGRVAAWDDEDALAQPFRRHAGGSDPIPQRRIDVGRHGDGLVDTDLLDLEIEYWKPTVALCDMRRETPGSRPDMARKPGCHRGIAQHVIRCLRLDLPHSPIGGDLPGDGCAV